MMRTISIAVAAAALLAAGDLAAQAEGAGWRAPIAALAPSPADPRLRPGFARPSLRAGELEMRAPRLSLPGVMLVGSAVGCVAGALVMGSGGDDRDRAPRRFNGCILGLPAGMVIGGVYGLVTGR